MRYTDSSNYHTLINVGTTYNNIWNYGRETWCNLEGRYLHIIADLSHLAGEGYNMQLCSVGIMGTQYIRATPVPDNFTVS